MQLLNAVACICQAICDVTSSNVLGPWDIGSVWEERVDGGTLSCVWVWLQKSLSRVISPTLSANGPRKLTSYLHAVFKFDLLAGAG